MATTTQEAIVICNDRTFKERLVIVIAFVAKGVLAEATSVPFHNTRARYAVRYLARPMIEVDKACIIVSLSPGVRADATDAVLIQAVRTNFNILAGVFSAAAGPADGIRQEVVIEETDHDNNPATPPIVKRTFRNLFGLLR